MSTLHDQLSIICEYLIEQDCNYLNTEYSLYYEVGSRLTSLKYLKLLYDHTDVYQTPRMQKYTQRIQTKYFEQLTIVCNYSNKSCLRKMFNSKPNCLRISNEIKDVQTILRYSNCLKHFDHIEVQMLMSNILFGYREHVNTRAMYTLVKTIIQDVSKCNIPYILDMIKNITCLIDNVYMLIIKLYPEDLRMQMFELLPARLHSIVGNCYNID